MTSLNVSGSMATVFVFSRESALSAAAESLLIITGTMGAGKTAVLGEASDILAQRQIIHAAIDLDAVGVLRIFRASNAQR